jgi:hypothetical protein
MELDDTPDPVDAIQPKSELLSLVKPNPDLPVRELLKTDLPSRAQALDVPLMDWFTTSPPNMTINSLNDLVIPLSSKTCRDLDSSLRAAINKGCISICHPIVTGKFFPIEVVRLFKWGDALHNHVQTWMASIEWIHTQAREENWPSSFEDIVVSTILSLPHLGSSEKLQRGVSYKHLAETMLSFRWLTGDALDCIMDVIRDEAGLLDRDGNTLLLGTSFTALGMKENRNDNSPFVQAIGKSLKFVKQLIIPANILDEHWVALFVNTTPVNARVVDSIPQVFEKHTRRLESRATQWVKDCLADLESLEASNIVDSESSEASNVDDLKNIRTFVQDDSFSCGLAVGNVIHAHVSPLKMCIWNPKKRAACRAYYFLRCAMLGQDLKVIPVSTPL